MRSRTGIIIALVTTALAAVVIAWLALRDRPSDALTGPTEDAGSDASRPADAAPAAPAVRLIPQGIEGFDDLPSNVITAVVVAGSTSEPVWFVGTDAGLAISRDGGQTFATRTAERHGLASNHVLSLHMGGDTLYVGTDRGLSISRDRGDSFVTAPAPASSGRVSHVTGSQGSVYLLTRVLPRVGTQGSSHSALLRSSDGGTSFVRLTLAGIPEDTLLRDLLVAGTYVFVATSDRGLLVSPNGGASFDRIEGLVLDEDRSDGDICGDESCNRPYPVLGEVGSSHEVPQEALARHQNDGDDSADDSAGENGNDLSAGENGNDHGSSGENGNDHGSSGENSNDHGSGGENGNDDGSSGGENGNTDSAGDESGDEDIGGGDDERDVFSVATLDLLSLAYVEDILYVGTEYGLLISDPAGRNEDAPRPFTRFSYQRLGQDSDDHGLEIRRMVPAGKRLYLLSRALHVYDTASNELATFGTELPEFTTGHVNGQTVLLGAATGLYVSRDRGAHVTARTTRTGLPVGRIERVLARGDTIFALATLVEYGHGVFVSRDRGASFTRLPDLKGLLRDIFVDGDRVLMAGNEGLFLSTDGGKSVRKLQRELDYARAHAVTEHGGVTYVATSKGMAISRDGGASFAFHPWPDRDLPTNQILVHENHVYLATEQGLAVSSDGGKSFALTLPCPQDSPLCKDADKWQRTSVKSLAMHGDDLYAIGAGTLLLRSTDGGRNLTPVVDSAGAARKGITALTVHGNRLWLGTREGVLVSSDHGKTAQPPAHLDALRAKLMVEIKDIAISGDTLYLATPSGLAEAAHLIETTP